MLPREFNPVNLLKTSAESSDDTTRLLVSWRWSISRRLVFVRNRHSSPEFFLWPLSGSSIKVSGFA